MMPSIWARFTRMGMGLQDISLLSGLDLRDLQKMQAGLSPHSPHLNGIALLCSRAGNVWRRRAIAEVTIESWKPIPGFPGYEASSVGRVRRIRTYASGLSATILQPNMRADGYLRVSLWLNGKHYHRHVHRLICLAFHGVPSLGLMACHQDGQRTHNTPENLYWGTAADNYSDQLRHGTARLRAGETAKSPLVKPTKRGGGVQNQYSAGNAKAKPTNNLTARQIKKLNKVKMLGRLNKLRKQPGPERP